MVQVRAGITDAGITHAAFVWPRWRMAEPTPAIQEYKFIVETGLPKPQASYLTLANPLTRETWAASYFTTAVIFVTVFLMRK